MLSRDEAQHRIERLRALIDHPDFGGNRATLAAALGLNDGSQIYQWLNAVRPITEKTIAKIESLRGGRYSGWFTRTRPSPSSVEEWPFGKLISPAQWAALTWQERGVVVTAAWRAFAEVVDPARLPAGLPKTAGEAMAEASRRFDPPALPESKGGEESPRPAAVGNERSPNEAETGARR